MMSEFMFSFLSTLIEETTANHINWESFSKYNNDNSEINATISSIRSGGDKVNLSKSYYAAKNQGNICIFRLEGMDGPSYLMYAQIKDGLPLIQLDGHLYNDQEYLNILSNAIENYVFRDVVLPDDLYSYLRNFFDAETHWITEADHRKEDK